MIKWKEARINAPSFAAFALYPPLWSFYAHVTVKSPMIFGKTENYKTRPFQLCNASHLSATHREIPHTQWIKERNSNANDEIIVYVVARDDLSIRCITILMFIYQLHLFLRTAPGTVFRSFTNEILR